MSISGRIPSVMGLCSHVSLHRHIIGAIFFFLSSASGAGVSFQGLPFRFSSLDGSFVCLTWCTHMTAGNAPAFHRSHGRRLGWWRSALKRAPKTAPRTAPKKRHWTNINSQWVYKCKELPTTVWICGNLSGDLRWSFLLTERCCDH